MPPRASLLAGGGRGTKSLCQQTQGEGHRGGTQTKRSRRKGRWGGRLPAPFPLQRGAGEGGEGEAQKSTKATERQEQAGGPRGPEPAQQPRGSEPRRLGRQGGRKRPPADRQAESGRWGNCRSGIIKKGLLKKPCSFGAIRFGTLCAHRLLQSWTRVEKDRS